MEKFKNWSATAIYVGDNGRTYCGEHLGFTAMMTGRDLSGQRVHKVTPKQCAAAGITPAEMTCERCGRGLVKP